MFLMAIRSPAICSFSGGGGENSQGSSRCIANHYHDDKADITRSEFAMLMDKLDWHKPGYPLLTSYQIVKLIRDIITYCARD